MEKVIVNATDLKLITDYQDEGYTLSDFFEYVSLNKNHQYLHDKYSYDQIAAIWIGHYEVKKTLREKIIDKHNESYVESYKTDGYAEAFRDGLKWVLGEIDKEGE